ncbi:MAG: hypothetical protein JOY93_04555 [Acidobacteriales bacterium]|nr:hypothetical protein [Terriglobales bacterium]
MLSSRGHRSHLIAPLKYGGRELDQCYNKSGALQARGNLTGIEYFPTK